MQIKQKMLLGTLDSPTTTFYLGMFYDNFVTDLIMNISRHHNVSPDQSPTEL